MFGDRLKVARKRAGYSLRGLSDAIEGQVSAQALGKYERGEMMPRSTVLLALTKQLTVSPEYLLSDQVESLEAVEFRKLSGTSARERATVEAEVIDRLQRYFEIEEILSLDSAEWPVPKCGNRFIGKEEEGELLANKLRVEWELGTDPIPNMTALLEAQGIKVLILPLPNRVSGLTCLVARPEKKTKVPVIVVNQDHPLERRRHTLAHELAHRLIKDDSPADHEKASAVFAGAFLVCGEHLMREIGRDRKALSYQELINIKRMYRVSAASLLMRLKQVGIVDDSTVAYAFQTYARTWRRTEPSPLEDADRKSERPRRFEQLCFRALAERLISPAKAGELLQWPLADIENGMRGPGVTGAACKHWSTTEIVRTASGQSARL